MKTLTSKNKISVVSGAWYLQWPMRQEFMLNLLSIFFASLRCNIRCNALGKNCFVYVKDGQFLKARLQMYALLANLIRVRIQMFSAFGVWCCLYFIILKYVIFKYRISKQTSYTVIVQAVHTPVWQSQKLEQRNDSTIQALSLHQL